MTIQREIRRSEATIQWLDRQIDGVETKSDDRTRLAACCLHMAHEHHKAIVLLVAKSLVGSAFALVRLIFEAYVRGIWLHRCASDREVARFKAEKLKKGFDVLVQEIEELDGFESGTLSNMKKKSWKAMNSFTHTGFAQAVRRTTDTTIEPNYDAQEVLEALHFSRAIDFLSAIATADLAGNLKLANDVLERATVVTTEP